MAAMVAGGLLLWGLAWTAVPPLYALRTGLTFGTPSAAPTLGLIIGMVVLLASLALTPLAQRTVFKVSDRRSMLALGSWRTVFGTCLIAIGLTGGLPPGFFWSAGIGDIAVGVASTVLLARGGEIPDRPWLVWNAMGLLDLLHVISLAAFYIAPFFVANPHLPIINLVPLLIVPSFIALHVGALRALLGAPRVAAAAANA